MDPSQIAVFIPIVALFIPITAIWTHHLRKMAEIKAQQGTTLPPDVRVDLTQMKRQLDELRETTTRFDMSFDAAVTRLEQRVDSLEERQAAVPQRTTAVVSEQEPNVLVQGQGR